MGIVRELRRHPHAGMAADAAAVDTRFCIRIDDCRKRPLHHGGCLGLDEKGRRKRCRLATSNRFDKRTVFSANAILVELVHDHIADDQPECL